MKLVILHHHFESGGVLRVVEAHLSGMAALPADQRPTEVLLLHGGRGEGCQTLLQRLAERRATDHRALLVREAVIDALEYDDRCAVAATADVWQAIESVLLEKGFQSSETVLHVHNPMLGKVAQMPAILANLANRGWTIIAHLHDFAEDLRPENLLRLIIAAGVDSIERFSSWLYPQHPNVSYVALTEHDAQRLRRLVNNQDVNVVVIPNAVVPLQGAVPDRDESRRLLAAQLNGSLRPEDRYYLYPVRGIRRKNLGELLFLAALLEEPVQWGITLPPTTKVERESWQRWRTWSETLGLPIHFGTAELKGVTLGLQMAACDAVVTTSLAEGFGLAFIEPWQFGKPTLGRDLPAVTDELRQRGMRLDRLYKELSVELTREERLQVAQQRQRAWQQLWNQIPKQWRDVIDTEADSIREVRQNATDIERIDFGALPVEWQLRIVKRVVEDTGYRRCCRQWLSNALDCFEQSQRGTTLDEEIAVNVSVLERELDSRVIAGRWMELYQRSLCCGEGDCGEGLVGLGEHSGEKKRSPVPPRATGRPQEASFSPVRTEDPVLWSPFLRFSRSLQPIPTGHPERLPSEAPRIKAFIFDIYGTLLISGTGDIGTVAADSDQEALEATLRELAVSELFGESLQGQFDEQLGEQADDSLEARMGVERMRGLVIQQQARLREAGVDYPEIDIERVWYQWLEQFPGFVKWDLRQRLRLAELLSETFEARANRTAEMPGARELLRSLAQRGYRMGIVSNAQRYTAAAFEVALGATWESLGFDPDLIFLSYRYQQAKPGKELFQSLLKALKRQGICANESLYVGNDMLNDVTAARGVGMVTALFAGDQRSLRLRTGDDRVKGVEADMVISHLSQLVFEEA